MARLFILLFVLLLTGCDQRSSPDYLMEEYLKRISRVTEQSLSYHVPVQLPRPPELRLREHPVPDIRMKFLDALDLLSCPSLSQVVASRNSSLGKQMLPSQRLHYEKLLLARIGDCLHHLTGSDSKPETVRILREIAQQKTAQLPASRWNLLFAHTELAGQLSDTGRLLSLQGDDGRQGTLAALNYLAGYLPDNSLSQPYTRQELEQHLQQLHASDYSGKLLTSSRQLDITLNQAAAMLEARMATSPVCPKGQITPEAERLMNVFRLFYSGEGAIGIQPFLARVHREGREWRQALSRIMKQLPPPPTPEMKVYLDSILTESSPGSLWHILEQATTRHTQVWQELLGQCGRMPGRPVAAETARSF
ncbi:MAG: DUF3080 family protein [Endozoicomonas sp.]